MVSIFSRRIQRRGESFLGPGRPRLVIRPVFAVAGWLASPPGLSRRALSRPGEEAPDHGPRKRGDGS